jgi:hypothetical protein
MYVEMQAIPDSSDQLQDDSQVKGERRNERGEKTADDLREHGISVKAEENGDGSHGEAGVAIVDECAPVVSKDEAETPCDDSRQGSNTAVVVQEMESSEQAVSEAVQGLEEEAEILLDKCGMLQNEVSSLRAEQALLIQEHLSRTQVSA